MTEQEKTIEGMKANIEAQLREYEEAIIAAVQWHSDWQKRQQNRGFRCTERA